MATITIDDDWRPTAENINALPMPLRVYIHKLETHWDPAGTLQEVAELRDLVAQLSAAVEISKVFGKG